MEIAASLIGKALKKLLRQAEPERAGHILLFLASCDAFLGEVIQSAPNQIRSSTEVDHATGQAFVHRNVSLPGEGISRVKTGSITADAGFVAQPLDESLAERDSAVLNGMMSVYLEVADAAQLKIQHGVLGEKREHVVEKGDTGFNRRCAATVNIELHQDICLLGFASDLGSPLYHCRGIKSKPRRNSKPIHSRTQSCRPDYCLAAVVELVCRLAARSCCSSVM